MTQTSDTIDTPDEEVEIPSMGKTHATHRAPTDGHVEITDVTVDFGQGVVAVKE